MNEKQLLKLAPLFFFALGFIFLLQSYHFLPQAVIPSGVQQCPEPIQISSIQIGCMNGQLLTRNLIQSWFYNFETELCEPLWDYESVFSSVGECTSCKLTSDYATEWTTIKCLEGGSQVIQERTIEVCKIKPDFSQTLIPIKNFRVLSEQCSEILQGNLTLPIVFFAIGLGLFAFNVVKKKKGKR